MWRVVVLAAILGSVLTLAVDRFLAQPESLSDAPAPLEPDGPTPPTVQPAPLADPGAARSLVGSVLPTLGVSSSAIKHGVYPLRGAGRAPGDTLPLVSFTCPVDRGCNPVFRTLEQLAKAQGMALLGHDGEERSGRALYRALSSEGRPALALRAYPPAPRLSVLLTGVGQDPALLDAILRLDADVTHAVHAGAPNAPLVARRLTDAGREIIAHLPMEPMSPAPGESGRYLAMSMSGETIQNRTAAFLDRVPGAVGADNRDGSRLTTSRVHMQALLSVFAERGIFFFDGRTSDASVAHATARARGVRAAFRTHRLQGDGAAIQKQLKSVEVALALEGHVVVVAEATPSVIGVLPRWLGALRTRRVSLLRLSEIVL